MGAHCYFVRPGPSEELRFSLRSLAVNVDPAADVWIVGDPPDWYTGPRIPGNHWGTKQRNVWGNVRILAEHPDLPAEVAVWNDDMYALAPADVEMAYRDTLAGHIAPLRSGWWRESLTITLEYLREAGIDEPLSYELHRPFPIVREDMARILADAATVRPDNPPQWRTLYGNLAHAGGTQDHDGKVYGTHTPIPSGPWMSTTDRSFRSVARRLRSALPHPSPWETDHPPDKRRPRTYRRAIPPTPQ